MGVKLLRDSDGEKDASKIIKYPGYLHQLLDQQDSP